MTPAVRNLADARPNTPNWPPLDQDVWADRNGTRWITHRYEMYDEIRTALLNPAGQQRGTSDFVLEMFGPLTLVSAGWERARNQRTAAVAA